MHDMKKEPIGMVIEITKVYDSYLRNEMKKNGMKTSYRHLLSPLAIKDGCTQLDLVKVSHLKAPTVSTTLRNMEAEGLVTRETDKDDARATRVFITQKGKDVDKKMRKSIAEIEGKLLEGVSDAEKKAFTEVAAKLYANADEISRKIYYYYE